MTRVSWYLRLLGLTMMLVGVLFLLGAAAASYMRQDDPGPGAPDREAPPALPTTTQSTTPTASAEPTAGAATATPVGVATPTEAPKPVAELTRTATPVPTATATRGGPGRSDNDDADDDDDADNDSDEDVDGDNDDSDPTGPVATVGPSGTATLGPTGTPTSLTVATPVPPAATKPLPTVDVAAEGPTRMKQGDSGWVRVAVIPRVPSGPTTARPAGAESGQTPPGPASRATILATPIPVGTPDVPIDQAFGAGYLASASADISAPAFEVEQSSHAAQSYDGSHLVWEWVVSPKRTGRQTIDVSINVEWSPMEGEPGRPRRRTVRRTIWAQPLEVEVSTDFFNIGGMRLSEILTGIGAAFSASGVVPLVLGIVAKRMAPAGSTPEAGESGPSASLPRAAKSGRRRKRGGVSR